MASLGTQNHFLKLAKDRKTTYEFSDKQIKNNDINKILEAARWSPSCSNIQPWYFIVVKDEKQIAKLIEIASYGAFHTNPTLLVALVLNFECWKSSDHRCIRNGKLGTIEAYLCIAMPALSMIFEAKDLGIDSCLLTPEQEKAAKILRIKKGDAVPLMVCFGYEKRGVFQKKRERKELKELVSYDYYGRRDK